MMQAASGMSGGFGTSSGATDDVEDQSAGFGGSSSGAGGNLSNSSFDNNNGMHDYRSLCARTKKRPTPRRFSLCLASAQSAAVPETGGKKRGRMMRQDDGSFKFVMGAE